MESFLNFLSNNYLYFLIAAGVFLFALIGFLFDLKRRKKESPEVETPTPEITNETPITEAPVMPVETLMSSETINPAPPMPNTDDSVSAINEPIEVNSTINTEILDNLDSESINVEELR